MKTIATIRMFVTLAWGLFVNRKDRVCTHGRANVFGQISTCPDCGTVWCRE